MTARKAITERMKIDCLLWRTYVVCSECKGYLKPGDRIDWDHIWPISQRGPHTHDNLRPLHHACHKDKTERDVQANAKSKRLEREREGKPKRSRIKKKIPSRPFPKRAA